MEMLDGTIVITAAPSIAEEVTGPAAQLPAGPSDRAAQMERPVVRSLQPLIRRRDAGT